MPGCEDATPLAPLVFLLVVLLAPTLLVVLFPASVQGWARRAFDRNAWLRPMVSRWTHELLTSPRKLRTWRLFGLFFLPWLALVANVARTSARCW